MELSEFDTKTLKAMAYDEIVNIQNAQARLNAINSEIANRIYENKSKEEEKELS